MRIEEKKGFFSNMHITEDMENGKKKTNGSFQAVNPQKQEESVSEQKRKMAKQKAAKVIQDKLAEDSKRDAGLDESGSKIEEAKKTAAKANEEMLNAPEEMADYYKKQIQDAQKIIVSESSSIKDTKLAMLKERGMVDAKNQEEDMMQAASKEFVGSAFGEIMQNVDEKFEETKEAAEKKKEEEEEKQEKLDEIKKEREEREAQIQENSGAVSQTAETSQSAETVQKNVETVNENMEKIPDDTELQRELKKVAEQGSLLEEDMKGLLVNQQV